MMVFQNLLIQPLVLVFDIIFVYLYDFFGVPGVAIIFLNIIVNLAALPLYRQADRIQKDERLQQEKMKPWVQHIKKAFSGDEQYMMLSAYYKVEHYSPASVLKETFPLLLQIPIFMAAYRYLSSASVLTGAAFGPIQDLGSPDGLLSVAGITINALPVLMTALNLVSAAVYTRGKGIWLKIQAFGLALVFLVLLYNGPAGLALYWTMSQVFSIVKNLIMETNILKKRQIMLPLSIVTIFAVLICTSLQLIRYRAGEVISELCLILSLLYLIRVILELKNVKLPSLKRLDSKLPVVSYAEFIPVGLALFALTGLCIPSSVLSSSASEFIETATGSFQSYLLTYPLTVYAGLFLVWTSIYYYFSGRQGRRVLFALLLVLLGTGLVNYFAFDVKPSFYYADLSFDGELPISQRAIVLNIISAVAVTVLLFLLWLKQKTLLRNLSVILALSLLFLGGYHALKIPQALKTVSKEADQTVQAETEDMSGILSLSRTGKNVIILMLDRAIGAQVPFIFDEFPEWKEAYDGFVFYPNTVSYGSFTLVGAPPLYGGYEYAPKRIAENTNITDNNQRMEALKVLPVLFSQEGFDTAVSDPALFGLSLYENYPDINAFKLAGMFNGKYADLFYTDITPIQMRNFLVFSLYKTAPLYMRDKIYDDGAYMQAENKATAYTQAFLDNYFTLLEFPNITSVSETSKGSFLFLQNSTTHEPTALDAPDYEVKRAKNTYETVYGDRTVDGRTMKMENFWSWRHYCVNVVAYRELIRWFDRMKELGVYDNTRIILVADHGADLAQFDDFILSDGFDVEHVNPLLMVKDFNARGTLHTDDTLMTNADVPTLATENVIENPVNPFTGVPISNDDKSEDVLWIESGAKKLRTAPDDDLSVGDLNWWTVHDSIFDQSNWEKVE